MEFERIAIVYSLGVTFSGSGGSLISQVPISVETGGSQNYYEVNTTLALNSGGGTYIHFLHANSTAVVGSGSYISVELTVPSGFSGSAAAVLVINQCINGTITQLSVTTVTASNGMILRSVILPGGVWVFVNSQWVWSGPVPTTTGSPGIGGYNMPAGSGFSGVKLGHRDTVAPKLISMILHSVPTVQSVGRRNRGPLV